MTVNIYPHILRDGSASRDRAILDALGVASVALLKALWGCSQSQVSRRMSAIDGLGMYRVRSGWGRYTLIQPRPEKPAQTTSRERWETVRQLREVVG